MREYLKQFWLEIQNKTNGSDAWGRNLIKLDTGLTTFTVGYGYFDGDKVHVEEYKTGDANNSYQKERVSSKVMTVDEAVELFMKVTNFPD